MSQLIMSRRTMLRGLGTAIALPVLDAMIPGRLAGAEAKAAVKAIAPRRLAWLYVPNGIDMQNWTPAAVGSSYELKPILQPVAEFRDRFTLISGLVCDKANPHGDGGGDHGRASASYLTGAQARKTEGANLKCGLSADQAAANKIGHLTKFPSLELGVEDGKQTGRCDNGYSCAYYHTISWRSETTPVVKDCDPRSVFDRLFSNGDPRESAESRARRENDHKSILDFVLDDAGGFEKKLTYADRQKMDEYLTSVREIEVRLEKASLEPAAPPPAGAVRPDLDVHATTRDGTDKYAACLPLMIDMLVLAFQTDRTRIVTLPFADEKSNQTYPWAGANVPHHSTSHHMGDAAKKALIAKINTYHVEQLAYLLKKLDAIKEANGASILDNSLISYGSNISDGDRHNHDDLPQLLIGRGGGTVSPGRHLRCDDVPLNNLWLSMLDRVGAPLDRLGDSTGRIALA
ncbi:MAG TPA: DUF1552 domain-containing protein [Opitutaceae bacterium]|nr:DUF1552 domain-containing protein [Lacunisphaera sp.]HWA07967.1 DUF1552 domain-containing protein [Opitutaceae bacterium]